MKGNKLIKYKDLAENLYYFFRYHYYFVIPNKRRAIKGIKHFIYLAPLKPFHIINFQHQ